MQVGYASILFRSLLKVNKVIGVIPQTDLQYCVDNLPDSYNGKHTLIKRSKQCPATWSKYNKIVNVLNDSVSYSVQYSDTQDYEDFKDLILHGDHHYDQIKQCPSVSKFSSKENVISLTEKFLEE